MGTHAADAVMAIAFFSAIAITAVSIAAVWIKRINARREIEPTGAVSERLERIEAAVDAISIEVERISEAQRFSARLLAEGEAARHAPPARAAQGRVITPH